MNFSTIDFDKILDLLWKFADILETSSRTDENYFHGDGDDEDDKKAISAYNEKSNPLMEIE